jgi:hypothetical protein
MINNYDLVRIIIPKIQNAEIADIANRLVADGLVGKPFRVTGKSTGWGGAMYYNLVSHRGDLVCRGLPSIFLRRIKISLMEYEVGDIVKIVRGDYEYWSALEKLVGPGKHGAHAGFNFSMCPFMGRKAVVKSISQITGFIHLQNLDETDINYSWRNFWLIPKRLKGL